MNYISIQSLKVIEESVEINLNHFLFYLMYPPYNQHLFNDKLYIWYILELILQLQLTTFKLVASGYIRQKIFSYINEYCPVLSTGTFNQEKTSIQTWCETYYYQPESLDLHILTEYDTPFYFGFKVSVFEVFWMK